MTPEDQELKWISVKDQLPEPMAKVLLLYNNEWESEAPCMAVGWRYEQIWSMFNPCCSYTSDVPNVTHWIPLPEGPKNEDRS